MKPKRLRRALALLLVMLLCFSVITPAVSAGSVETAATGADGDVLERHADNATVTKANLQTLFGDSTSLVNTAFYGFAPVPEEGTALDTSTITYVTGTSNIGAGNWLALKTTANGGTTFNRKPNWDDASKRSQLNFSVRTYYTASFTVNGSADGALYLNDEAVSGNVNLYTDTEYTVTAANVEGFTREVNGVTLGEVFTPNADMTITADYTADASAAISLTVGEGGTAKIISDGAQVTTDTIPAGKLFTVEATPNTNRGYKTESIIVTKNGEAVESGDGIYGPVADGEVYAVTVSFKYDPDHVAKEVIGTDAKVSRTDLSNFLGSYSYYGIAPASDPDDITQLIAVVRPNYDVTAGEYIIYATNDNTGGLLPSPIWTNAKLMVLDVRVYYNGTFTVTGNDEGEVYLNGESVTGTQKLYTDTEYTVTAKNIDEYGYAMEGAQDGTAFTPNANIDVTVTYTKLAYATISLSANEGGTAAVYSNGNVVTDRVSESDTFTVEATPNELKGYELESIVVKKDGDEVEAVDGAYGPVADQEAYEITVTFRFNPPAVDKEVDANEGDVSRSDVSGLFNGAYSYYGIAPESDPDDITYLAVALTSDYDVVDGGKYYIYGSNDGNILSPKWTNAKLMLMTVRTYYTGTFTVSGHDEGEVYLNGESVTGSKKLYTDTEYTVTAKNVDEYEYAMEGAEDGTAFTPNANIDVTVTYTKLAYATISLTVSEGGTAAVYSNGNVVTDRVSEGDTFTVEATPNELKGYELDSIVVKKDGVEVEAVDGAYGPVADQEAYEITVTFRFNPPAVDKEVDANEGDISRSDVSGLFNGAYSYYGIAPESDPDNITYLAVALTSDYDVVDGGKYYIYGSNDGNILSPKWTNAKLMLMTVRTYYTGTFTVSGHDEGEVYLNGESVTGSKKLYTDTEYTVTAKNIDDYEYAMEGAEDGTAFTPTADINVTVTYTKLAYATFTLNANEGGTAEVQVNGDQVTDRVSEGDSFTVVVTPNTNRGYKVDRVVVKKDGEEVEAVDGVYGPVADQEAYEITVTFRFDPDVVDYEMDANNTKLYVTDFYNMFDQELGTYSYGFSSIDDPGNITTVGTLAGATISAGEYYIYRTAYSLTNPNWNNAKIYRLNLRSYYNGAFTVNGHNEGEVYLNGESVTGSKKLYTDTEYTVTAKDIEEYGYVMEGAEDGTAFTPTSNINVTVTYTKLAYATFSLRVSDGGTVEVQVNGEAVTDRVSEGDSFKVQATPNTDRGYKVDKITVVNGETEIEPDESGAYGPVTDGEQYFITVTFRFDPDVVDYEMDANNTKLYVTDFYNMFDQELGTYSYGFSSIDDPGNITTVGTLAGATISAGEYYIYRTSYSLTNPNWNNAKIYRLNLRSYYDATFTVTAPEEMPENGALYLNGADVTGAQKLYTDTEYTVTAKAVEGYIYTVYGIEEGTAFTPAEDIEVSAVYMKETYATVDVTANEGGTVKIMSDGVEVFDKVPEGNMFTINATADAENDYYVESIVVKKNGEDYESADGIYGPVLDQENYEVTVTFAKATLSLDDCDVVLIDIRDKKFTEIEQSILSNVTLTPEMFADDAQFKVEYAAYKVLALDIYAPLNYNTTLSHAFGTSELGGELLDGNTEKIRVTCTIPSRNIEMTAYATATVKDVREATEIAGEYTTITYGDDLKAALMPTITVTDSNGDPVAFTADDITVSPTSLNVRLLSAQEVTIRYNGNDYYAASENTVNVYVRQAQSSLDTKSETITYGETPKAEVITTPENLDYIKVIAGIDGDAQGFVSIDIPNSVKERMKIKVGDLVLLDIYKILSDRIGEGSTINDLKALILDIYNRIDSNEAIKRALEASGFNMEILDNIMSFIEELPDSQSSLKIRLNQVPENAGAYLLFAVSTDINYTVSADLSTIIIKPQTEEEGGAYELRFKAEMQGEGAVQFLDYDEAQDFAFGGDFYIGDTLTETENLHTLYVGTTLKGDLISQEEPVREPGAYVETVYYQESNKWVTPIIRSYTINRIETELKMDDLTVAYDGEAHALTAYLEDADIVEDNLTYSYVGSGYIGSEAPVNAGEYTVYAFYTGDDTHMAASVLAKLTITKLDATITVTCTEEVTYGDINFYNATDVANIQYTVSGTINDDELGLIIPTLNGQGFFTVGDYNATVNFIQTNPNYNVTIENATLTIVPREIILTIDDMEKTYGEDDPAYSYMIVDGKGNAINADMIGLTITREEGEDIGEYAISASIRDNVNNTLTYSPASLTINAKPIIVTIDDKTKDQGKIDPVFTYTITDSQGNAIDPAAVRLTIARDVGEEIGEYEIFVARVGNKNYVLDTENSTSGTLTIAPAKRGYILGDADGDGDVNAVDVTLILRKLAATPSDADFDKLAADVDGDGEVTVIDATLLQRYNARMRVDYPIGQTQYEEIV